MSKYKVGFLVNSNANAFCTNVEVVDLIDDYKFTEERAKEIVNDIHLLNELLEEWLWNTIEINFKYLKNDKEVKKWLERGN